MYPKPPLPRQGSQPMTCPKKQRFVDRGEVILQVPTSAPSRMRHDSDEVFIMDEEAVSGGSTPVSGSPTSSPEFVSSSSVVALSPGNETLLSASEVLSHARTNFRMGATPIISTKYGQPMTLETLQATQTQTKFENTVPAKPLSDWRHRYVMKALHQQPKHKLEVVTKLNVQDKIEGTQFKMSL